MLSLVTTDIHLAGNRFPNNNRGRIIRRLIGGFWNQRNRLDQFGSVVVQETGLASLEALAKDDEAT
jgi:hypothetical protein